MARTCTLCPGQSFFHRANLLPWLNLFSYVSQSREPASCGARCVSSGSQVCVSNVCVGSQVCVCVRWVSEVGETLCNLIFESWIPSSFTPLHFTEKDVVHTSPSTFFIFGLLFDNPETITVSSGRRLERDFTPTARQCFISIHIKTWIPGTSTHISVYPCVSLPVCVVVCVSDMLCIHEEEDRRNRPRRWSH